MIINITGKHIEITDAIKEHTEQKISKLPRYFDGISNFSVIIENGQTPKIDVEIIATGEHNNVFVVKETGEDAYTCIDVAVHKMQRKLRKHKERHRNPKHIGGPEKF